MVEYIGGVKIKIYDISMAIEPTMPVYKGKASKRPILTADSTFESSSVHETRVEMNLHTGTHIDCPLHIIPGGTGIGSLTLDRVVTVSKVLDCTEVEEEIGPGHLKEKAIEAGDFVILKTRNSSQDILEGNYVYLGAAGAEYLANAGVGGVGIDALGIERNQPGHETHKTLLAREIVILEGLSLKDIEAGEYLLVAAPLNIPDAEAAPVRALLIDFNRT